MGVSLKPGSEIVVGDTILASNASGVLVARIVYAVVFTDSGRYVELLVHDAQNRDLRMVVDTRERMPVLEF